MTLERLHIKTFWLLKADVTLLAELSARLLGMGRLLKGKNIRAVRQNIERRYPEALTEIARDGASHSW